MAISHLNLNQTTSSIEVVTSAIIDKLYELAQTNLDETSDVQGNLQVVHTYEDAVTYLLNKFPNLQINVTSGAYIRFADQTVASICMTNWGDGIGVATTNVANVTSLSSKFKGNRSIVHFDELKYFTKLVNLDSYAFQDCVKLAHVNLVNVTSIGIGTLQGCASLTSLGDLTSMTSIGTNAFNGCTALSYMKCLTTTPPTLGSNSFSNATFKIYVPDSSVSAYKSATNWSAYASRIFSLTQFAIDFPNG